MTTTQTLLSILTLNALLCAGTLLAVRGGQLRDGQAAWVCGLLSLAAGWGCQASAQPWLVRIGPLGVAIGLSCAMRSIHALGRKPLARLAQWLPPVLAGLALILAPLAPHPFATLLALVCTLQLLGCAWPLEGHPGEVARPLRYATCGAFLAAGLGVAVACLPAATGTLPSSVLWWGALADFILINIGVALMHCERARLESERLASRDPLTGLFNRRSFVAQSGRELLRARRSDALISALMIDVDHFKRINDHAGHLAGDRVLRHIAGRLRATLREQDLCARHDRDTFCALLPDTGPEGARQLAQRLLQVVASAKVSPDDITYTISIGIATIAPGENTPQPMLARAEGALREAKQAGRNRIKIHDAEDCPA